MALESQPGAVARRLRRSGAASTTQLKAACRSMFAYFAVTTDMGARVMLGQWDPTRGVMEDVRR